MKHINEHKVHYIFLLIVLVLGVTLAMQSQYGRGFQLVAIVITAICYTIWGIVHHYVHHNLTAKIVIEYVLIASFGTTVLHFLLKGV